MIYLLIYVDTGDLPVTTVDAIGELLANSAQNLAAKKKI